jgi:hypothetical protein
MCDVSKKSNKLELLRRKSDEIMKRLNSRCRARCVNNQGVNVKP